MPFPHQHLAQTISDQLNVLAAQLKTRTRASQNDANHWLESVMARFFNALLGWDLVNLNADQPNFPAADLGDRTRRIAMQITNQNAASKITETAKKAEVHLLGEAFDRLILFFLLPEKPAMPKSFVQPPTGPTIECWDLADLLKQMPELPDQSCLSAAEAVLEKELGHQSASKEPPPSNLPGGYIGQTFVGREQFLKDLRTSLLKQTHTTAITQRPAATVTEGLGGLGKTHVAVEYADRHRGDYTALLFVSGDTPQRLQTSLAALCDVPGLHLNDDLPPEEVARASIALRWLATHPGWLLIVDNVDDEAAALALREHFEQLRNGHVLITSRLHSWSQQVDSLDLSVLSQEDATDLLLQLTEKHRRKAADDDTQARTLAELMEGLPLALHQAAGYINEQRLSFPQCLATYHDEAAELLNWFNGLSIPYERPDKLAPRPVLITWKTSFDQLDDDARFWLLVFSHFAHEPIPEFLLDAKPDADNDIKKLYRAAQKAIAQAGKFNLLTRYDVPPRFKIHRLVQEVTRLSSSVQECAVAINMGIQLTAAGYPGDSEDVRTWAQWTPLLPHALALCQHAPDVHAPERLTWLLRELSLLLTAKSLYAQAEPLIRRALKIDEASYGPEHPMVATDLNNLARLLQDANRLAEAEPLMRRVLQIDEANHGMDHPAVAIGLNNLATLLQDTNRLKEAEPLMRQGMVIAEASKGSSHPHIAIHLNNLSQLLSATNRQEEAEPLIRRALKIDEDSYGPEHPKVSISLNNLATLLQATNRLAEAEPLMRRALKIDDASYGSEHPNVARDLSNLAALLKATNRLAEAEPLMRRALQINEANYGPEHPKVAIQLNNLAQLLQVTNRLAEAESLMRLALQIDEISFGPNHPNVARDLNNLASLLQITNRLAEAEPLIRRALKIDEASYGPEHPKVATDLNNLSSLLMDTNQMEESERLMRRALQIDEASYGLDHPEVARDLNNLAQLLKRTNRLADAEPMMARVVTIFESGYGENHPKVAIALNNLAQLLHATNQLAEAEPLMRRALKIDETSYGPEHPEVARDLNNLARLLQDTNRLAEAELLMSRAAIIFESAYGKNHPMVATALNNLGQLLKDLNRLAEAELLMRRALRINEESYGLDHCDVAIGLNNLARLLQDTNRLEEAEPLLIRATSILVRSLGLDHPTSQRVWRNCISLLRALKLPDDDIEKRVVAAMREK